MSNGRSTHMQAVNEQQQLQRLLTRKGIYAIDLDTEAGAQVAAFLAELEKAADARIPEPIRRAGIEMFVEALLLKRAAVSSILRMGAAPTGISKKAESRRAAFRMNVTAVRSFSTLMKEACALMGIVGFGPKFETKEDETFETFLAKRRARLEARQASAGEDEAAGARGTAPTPEPSAGDAVGVNGGESPPQRTAGEGGTDDPLPSAAS